MISSIDWLPFKLISNSTSNSHRKQRKFDHVISKFSFGSSAARLNLTSVTFRPLTVPTQDLERWMSA